MKKILAVALTALLLAAHLSPGQIGLSFVSLDAGVASADLIVRARVVDVDQGPERDQWAWLDVTLEVEEIFKGRSPQRFTIASQVLRGDERLEQIRKSGEDQLWFLADSRRPLLGEDPNDTPIRSRHPFKPCRHWTHLSLTPALPAEPVHRRRPLPLFTMDFEIVSTPEELLAATKRIVAAEPVERPELSSLVIPRSLAQRSGTSGDANSITVPADQRLEAVAHRLIESPEDLLPDPDDWPATNEKERERNRRWLQFSANDLRAEGAKALSRFQSAENVDRLKKLLDHPAKVGRDGLEERHFFVRKAAYQVLKEWNIAVENPVLVEGRDARPPKNDEDLRYWLQNMVWHHKFGTHEITAALGIEEAGKIEKTLERFKINRRTKPRRAADAPLLVLPYPGGRHPRIGFLDGAINPQRETKISVFTPWDEESYVVADIPEAIWSNLGLTYLAHTHVDTIWTRQNIALEKLEWNRRADGTLDVQRKLPNGIEFATKVIPGKDAVRMEMWLKNGSKEKLTGLRVQNCVMLKGALGFRGQHNENKILRNPYVAVHNDEKNRWIITAWDPCHRPWANEKCPCLHSDPKFPDCAPGETQHLRGWLSFYEGKDLEAELKRIDATGWRK